MSWNYRVGKKTYKVSAVHDDILELTGEKYYADIYKEDQFGIIETYYNDKGEITFTTERFIEPYGETLDELKSSFEKMKEAFDLPILDLDNLVYSNKLWTNNYKVIIDY